MKTRGKQKEQKAEEKQKKVIKKSKKKSEDEISEEEVSSKKQTKKKVQPKPSSKKASKKESKKPKKQESPDDSSEEEIIKGKAIQKKVKKEDKKDDKKDEKKIDKKDDKKEEKKEDKKEDKKDDKKEDKKDDKKEEKKEEKIIKQTVKGGCAVDTYCPNKDQVHVYVTGSKQYDATLNQSNVVANNNKFYRIQLLESDDKAKYYIWNRWGRVGVVGQSALKGPMALHTAINDYEHKLHDKTVKGDYRILEITLENEEEEDQSKKEDTGKKVDSKLSNPVQNLISLIFDMKMMNQQMKEIGYDAKKMPLGKLSKQNMQKGYEILTKISEALKQKKPYSLLQQYSSDFYSYIPHDFGFKNMANFVLDTEKKVKDKIEMIQSISDIQIATKLLEDKTDPSEINQLDANYQKLHCDLEPIDKKSEEYKIIEKYVKNTHAATHTAYTIEIVDVFKMDRQSENDRFRKDINENKMLLWHGSRLTNYVGILSQGLRIAPPEAPATGYMFGKGVYFADMVSKSANYCFTNSNNNTGLLILNEVACGKFNQKFYADYNANILPKGTLSTKGCGRVAPPESSYVDLNGFKVPLGQGENQAVQGALQYNEYIVYDVNQIKMKYLLKCKFNYNQKGGLFF